MMMDSMKEYRRVIKRYDGEHVIESNDKRIADALAMSKRGIGSKPTQEDKDAFDGIKKLQEEFQKKYCPSCERYDPVKKDYVEKGHENNPEDCIRHWTDILGECWSYKPRKGEEPEFWTGHPE